MLNLSPKQKNAISESNARLNFWVGSVRSGKTYSSLLRWLEFVQEAPKGNLAMTGRTSATIKRNIIDEICNLIGADAHYFIGKQELTLWGRKIYIIPAVDERSEGKVRGLSLAGLYCDELTLIPQSFFTMALSRLSIPEAKLFATTNPDSPYHYIKTEFIDRQDELDLKVFEFYLDDNPSLTDGFKNALKKEYRGLWYKRFIGGEWCLAEGVIFDFFDNRLHVIDFPPGQAKEYLVGVDYGTINPTAFLLVGYNPRLYPNIWIEREYYYDSKEHNRQKTDSEYADDLKAFCKDLPISQIFIDPSAASFKLECQRQGIRNLYDANNDVLDGIRFVSSLFINGTLKICSQCANLIKEMASYRWDDKSKLSGIDKPLKQDDHLADCLRYIIFSRLGQNISPESRMTTSRMDRLRLEAEREFY